MPPLELRFGVNYESLVWSMGVSWRAVDEQSRVDIDKGDIAGQEIGPSDSSNIFSLTVGWRAGNNVQIAAGIDNHFDESYAEHISKAGVIIAGFEQTTRVN